MNNKLLTLEPMVQMMLRQQCKDEAPNTFIAYILWFVTGLFGGHLYYLAYKSKGGLRTIFAIAGGIYTFTLALGMMGWICDAILILLYIKMSKDENETIIVDNYLVANGMKEAVVEETKVGSGVSKLDTKYDNEVWGRNKLR